MFILETLSNMHVGSGETHFGVVDNLIQRHPVTKVPIIHASGIKGSLREYFDNNNLLKHEIPILFGGEVDVNKSDTKGSLDFSPGHLIFFEAQMLTIPLRASENVYYCATSVPVLLEYLEQLNNFFNANSKTEVLRNWLSSLQLNNNDFIYFKGSDDLEIEDYSNGKKLTVSDGYDQIVNALTKLCKIDIDKLAIFNKDIFTRICTDGIPVIARNQIKGDGTSGNLFYEEILPRKTTFYLMIGYDSYLNEQKKEVKSKFIEKITDSKNIFQFGANFSIGYGFSKLHLITL